MKFSSLLQLELKHLARQKLTWIVLTVLFVAMLAASFSGAKRVSDINETLAGIVSQEAEALTTVQDAARRYAVPGELQIDQFRDPTDPYGYMYSFMTRFATKPPAPLASISAGQVNMQPSYVRMNMNAIFPDSAYELRSPRILMLGSFDLGFVLVYFVPLGIIALGGSRLSAEQDSGVLRMIAAQPVNPRTVAAAKFLALALVIIPVVTISAFVSMAISGAIGPGATVASLAILAGAVALYVAFWIALCALIVSLWKGGVQSLAYLVLSWAGAVVLIPAAVSLFVSFAMPAPSRVSYIDASRTLMDSFLHDEVAGARKWLATRPDLQSVDPKWEAGRELPRLARDAYYRQALSGSRDAFAKHGREVLAFSDNLRLLAPPMVLDNVLQKLAGNDMASFLVFSDQADSHAQDIRSVFEPVIVATIGRAPTCVGCPGRLTFTDYEKVPTFARPPTASLVDAGVLVYMALVTGILAWIAWFRFRRWPT